MTNRETVEFARIVAFTDGVFAIAITLLVLTIEVPADLGAAELHEYLLDSWRQLFAYFLSFAVVGRFWLAHHRMFALLDGFDHTLLVLNLAYLALVVLAPFPTDLLGTYGDGTDAVVLYASLLGSIALLGWIMLRYCLRHDFVQRGARTQAEAMAPGAIAAAIVFYASIPVALVSPAAGQLVWLGLLLDGLRRRATVSRRREGDRTGVVASTTQSWALRTTHTRVTAPFLGHPIGATMVTAGNQTRPTTRKDRPMRKLYIPIVPVLVAVVGVGGGALATASDALALDSAAGAGSARSRAAEDPTLDKARGFITFRTQRYKLSDRAVVSTGSTTIRITDPAAINEQGDHPTSLYVEFGYIVDPKQTGMLRVNSGVAIRGYDFVTGTYDEGQVVQIGTSALGVDSPLGTARVVGHLNGGFERGIDLDVAGLRLS